AVEELDPVADVPVDDVPLHHETRVAAAQRPDLVSVDAVAVDQDAAGRRIEVVVHAGRAVVVGEAGDVVAGSDHFAAALHQNADGRGPGAEAERRVGDAVAASAHAHSPEPAAAAGGHPHDLLVGGGEGDAVLRRASGI